MNSVRSTSPAVGRHRRPAVLFAAAVALAPALLTAQWSGRPKFNNFVGADCPVPPANLQPVLALAPVMTPCNDGCFYAWVDSTGDVNIQILDSCGRRVLATPHTIAHGICGLAPLSLPAQIAGCEFDDPSTVPVETNQLFLAYTICGSSGKEELWGNVFTFAGGTIVPGAPCQLRVAATSFSTITPVADASVITFGENGQKNGAAVGWREWDYSGLGTVTMEVALVHGTAAAPVRLWTFPVTPAFPMPNLPPRLSIVSDHAGGIFAGWREIAGYMGTHVTGAGVLAAGAWPTPATATTRTADDWVMCADLQGGAFTAGFNDAGTAILVNHLDTLAAPSTSLTLTAVAATDINDLFAIVGIDPAPNSLPSTTRAALAYRANSSIRLVELTDVALSITAGNSIELGPIGGTTEAEGCAVLSHRGVAVGWVEHPGNQGPRWFYGQEVDVHAGTWPKLWNKGNKLAVSKNDHSGSFQPADKFAPMVVRKHTLPEVLFGWVDLRDAGNDLVTRGATTPGAYVQSVADSVWTIIGLQGAIKQVNGVLGSSIWCWRLFDPIDYFTFTLVSGEPSDPFDPLGGIGVELFMLNPADGTIDLLKDINPGAASSSPTKPIQFGRRRLFSAITATSGREPWVTDGTAAGTLQLADCAPGTAASSPTWISPALPGPALFTATSSGTGREFWRTDGTAAGTAMAFDLLPGPGSGVASTNTATTNGMVLFWGNDGVSGTELWRTDGTAGGTTMVADLSPGSASTIPGPMTALPDGRVVLSANVAGIGAEPYLFDPITMTVTLLGDLQAGSGSSSPTALTVAGAGVYFSANTATGREPWFTDGFNTMQVADVNPTASSNPANFTAAGPDVLFTATNGTHGIELWRTDGTTAGTAMVADLAPGAASSSPSDLTPIGGGLFVFTATDGVHGREPWVTDGTALGTAMLADLSPGTAGANPLSYAVVAGELWFDASIGGAPMTVRVPLAGPARIGQGCAGAFGVPRIDAPGGSPQLGQVFTVTVSNAAPNSIAALVYGSRSQPLTIGDCTLMVELPEDGMLVAFTTPGGTASLSLNVANDPALLGLTYYLQWGVVDPAGPLLGTFALSDALRITIE